MGETMRMPLRVLVVDDDPLTLATVRRVLRKAGHTTAELDGGFGFAMKLHKFEPDVVLLDINMPGLGGIGALKSARKLNPIVDGRPRIILHSGRSPEELEETCTELGADGYLCKPASREQLLAAIAPPDPTAASDAQPPRHSAK